MKYTFHIVDVFSSTPFGGNQLAVVPNKAVGHILLTEKKCSQKISNVREEALWKISSPICVMLRELW